MINNLQIKSRATRPNSMRPKLSLKEFEESKQRKSSKREKRISFTRWTRKTTSEEYNRFKN
jgi:hypothetical protein